MSLSVFVVSCVPQTQTTQQTQDPYGTPATYPAATTPDVQYPASTPTYPEVSSTPVYPSVDAPVPSAPATSSGQSYTIQAGDTLWGISQKYGTSVDAIQNANALSGTLIQPGQTIVIP